MIFPTFLQQSTLFLCSDSPFLYSQESSQVRSPGKSLSDIPLILCLTLAACASLSESLSETARREPKDHSAKSVQRQVGENKSSEIDAVLMPEWRCEIPNALVGNPNPYVEDAEQWSQLWTRWQPGKAVPDVDFKNSAVFVSISDAGDPNHKSYTFFRNPDGTIRPEELSTLVGYDSTDRSAIQFHILERN